MKTEKNTFFIQNKKHRKKKQIKFLTIKYYYINIKKKHTLQKITIEHLLCMCNMGFKKQATYKVTSKFYNKLILKQD